MTSLESWGDDGAGIAVVALHGRGQPPEFLHEVAERLAVPGLRWFAPSAPGRTWYPHPFLDDSAENAVSLEVGLDAVESALAEAAEGFERVVLLGFSQGACLASHLLLTRPAPVSAAVLFTGGYVGPEPLDPARTVARPGLPVLVRSIDRDPFVPAARTADTAALLLRAGAHVDALIEPGDEHGITQRAATDARTLLIEAASASPSQRTTA